MTINNVVNNQGKLGRLKPVSRVRNPFTCDECKKEFPVGSSGFTQSDYRESFFPVQRRICSECGERLISEGTEVKEKKKKEVKIKTGCGRDTKYPKPSGGFWKCGEEAPLIGAMLCDSCKSGDTYDN